MCAQNRLKEWLKILIVYMMFLIWTLIFNLPSISFPCLFYKIISLYLKKNKKNNYQYTHMQVYANLNWNDDFKLVMTQKNKK